MWQMVLAKAFCRLDFSTKSTLGLQKQVLSVRMLSGAHLSNGFCRLDCGVDFSSKIDALVVKADCVSQNAC